MPDALIEVKKKHENWLTFLLDFNKYFYLAVGFAKSVYLGRS